MQYGLNTLKRKGPPSDVSLAVSQLANPLILILLVAGAITVFIGNTSDAAIIFLAVLINTVLGFVQERKAHHSLAALTRMLVSRVRVRRNGTTQVVDATTLVPGDIVLLDAGDRIPADGVAIEVVNTYVNEAVLTGESMPVSKNTKQPLFMGTAITSGRAVMRVETIGMQTKIGAIAETLEDLGEDPTPLQVELSSLARALTVVLVITAAAVFLLGVVRNQAYGAMFTTAVALAVSSVPEGMTVTLTVILALGMQRILAKKALVRRLVAAETLGSVTVLCTDKTGTLTEGIMRVTETKLEDTYRAISAAVVANNLSDPIEVALWEWAENQDHIDPQQIAESETRTAELPFDSKRKFMAVATSSGLWVKGAPEVLLEKSTAGASDRRTWQKTIDTWARSGLRVIAVAHREKPPARLAPHTVERLTFLGIFGVSDPVRPEVSSALAQATAAGVAVKVVTGDYRVTAESVLAQLGLPIVDPAKEILEGKELAQLSSDELARRIGTIKLFCRVTPEQKLAIVDALKKNDEVVAMTGDGVNDALAIQKADIGIVVANASDVARETADMVLLDSSFATIVAAIEEGRAIFANIRKVVTYLLSDSFTEILLISASLVSGLPLPLTAAQILWINILSDGLPNLALAVDPKEAEAMHTKPQKQMGTLFSPEMRRLIAITSSAKAFLGMILFLLFLATSGNIPIAQTVVFAFISIGSVVAAFSLRMRDRPITRSHPLANPWLIAASAAGLVLLLGAVYIPELAAVSHTVPLAPIHWLAVVTGSGIFLLILEYAKRKTEGKYPWHSAQRKGA